MQYHKNWRGKLCVINQISLSLSTASLVVHGPGIDTQKYCTCWYQWIALLLRLLLSYPGMVAWITCVGLMKIEKEKNVTLHNFVQCSCKNIEQKFLICHQMYHGDWESHRECLINTWYWWITSRNRIYSSSKVKQPFTKMHICSTLNKLLPQNRCRCWLFHWSTSI